MGASFVAHIFSLMDIGKKATCSELFLLVFPTLMTTDHVECAKSEGIGRG